MWPFDQFFGRAKSKKKEKETPVESVASEVMDIFSADDEEKPLDGRRGHTGQFVKAVAIRRFRNRIAAASRKHNQKRRKAKKTGKKFRI